MQYKKIFGLSFLLFIFLAGCLNTSNQDPCSVFIGDDYKNECFIRLAIETENTEYCEKVKQTLNYLTGKADCYYSLAINKGDSSICKKAPETLTQEQCLLGFARETRNSSLCDNMTTSVKDACYMVLSVKNNDEGLCDKISSQDSSDSCYYKMALNKNDENLCNKIIDSQDREMCLLGVLGISGIIENPKKDQYQAGLEEDRDLMKLVKENKDPAICEQFSYKKNAEKCKDTTSPTYSGYCVTAASNIQTCYRIADALTETICDSFPDVLNRNQCIYDLAKQENDETVCEKIKIQGDVFRLNKRLQSQGKIINEQNYAEYVTISKQECAAYVRYG